MAVSLRECTSALLLCDLAGYKQTFIATAAWMPTPQLHTWMSLSLLRRSRSTSGHMSSQLPTMAPLRMLPVPSATARWVSSKHVFSVAYAVCVNRSSWDYDQHNQ